MLELELVKSRRVIGLTSIWLGLKMKLVQLGRKTGNIFFIIPIYRFRLSFPMIKFLSSLKLTFKFFTQFLNGLCEILIN